MTLFFSNISIEKHTFLGRFLYLDALCLLIAFVWLSVSWMATAFGLEWTSLSPVWGRGVEPKSWPYKVVAVGMTCWNDAAEGFVACYASQDAEHMEPQVKQVFQFNKICLLQWLIQRWVWTQTVRGSALILGLLPTVEKQGHLSMDYVLTQTKEYLLLQQSKSVELTVY